MSSYKKSAKSLKRTHRERGQVSERTATPFSAHPTSAFREETPGPTGKAQGLCTASQVSLFLAIEKDLMTFSGTMKRRKSTSNYSTKR